MGSASEISAGNNSQFFKDLMVSIKIVTLDIFPLYVLLERCIIILRQLTLNSLEIAQKLLNQASQ